MPFLPLALVGIAAASSTIYRHCNSRKLTSSVHHMLVKYHAFATELLQLLVLGRGMMIGWSFFSSQTIMLDTYIVSELDLPVPAWFVATMTVSIYILALFAIDLIDNRIQLGSWQHPVQTQTLLLTRSSLAPGSVWKIRCTVVKKLVKKSTKKQVIRKKVDPVATTSYLRKRTTSEPVTPEMLRRFLREIPIEVSKSGVLIREARAHARRSSAAATVVTPTRTTGDDAEGSLRTPISMFSDRKYHVQSQVESIERMVDGNELRDGGISGSIW